MLVRLTKKIDGRHRLTIVRDDGSASLGYVIPGFGADAIPHDLLHAVVERTLGFTRGVYGMVNEGRDIAELLEPMQKKANKTERELNWSEGIVAMLQSEGAYGIEALPPEMFQQRLAEAFTSFGLPAPVVTEEQLAELRRLRDEYQERWRSLPVDETIEVKVS